MLNRAVRFAGLAILVLAAMSAATARAQEPGYPCGLGYGYGIGLGYSHYSIRSQNGHDRIPYFALYPPVYYSGIVSRPYGVSPFAAPPGIRPVEMDMIEPVEPIMVENPFYTNPSESTVDESTPVDTSAVRADQSRSTTVVIINPFFRPDAEQFAGNRDR